uniref:hypothetical protein n=1 Tax=Bradyrhizobium semiaridum TaxID=2821404 RepID=UPI00201BD5A6|nr:hypothetical protein [Bradyrhizobium semiaridum]
MFLEEPVWPPEDFATLAEVRKEGRLDIAAGPSSGQFMSTISGTPGPIASRAAVTAGTVVSCSLIAE